MALEQIKQEKCTEFSSDGMYHKLEALLQIRKALKC
ncbi:MAG: hypothetical protein DDT21_02669 [Syntrophomonadaceae bacterium]|nr:hypothetical protein [Bacillota bacterium]